MNRFVICALAAGFGWSLVARAESVLVLNSEETSYSIIDRATRTEIGRAYSFYREQLTGLSLARIYTQYGGSGEGRGLREMQRQVFGGDRTARQLSGCRCAGRLIRERARPHFQRDRQHPSVENRSPHFGL